MLDFKVGKIYKDNDGKEWRYCGYVNEMECPYYFKYMTNGNFFKFAENSNNSVVCEGTGIKILFVEEKEEKKEGKEEYWRIYKKYDCIDTHNQKIISLELIEKRRNGPIIQYRFSGQELGTCYFTDLGEIAVHHGFVVYKNGIPQGVKDTINRLGKLVNKQRYFQKGQVYKDSSGLSWKFIKRAKVSGGLVAIFDQEGITGNSRLFDLYRLNNIELVLSNKNIYFCADESVRKEDKYTAARIKE